MGDTVLFHNVTLSHTDVNSQRMSDVLYQNQLPSTYQPTAPIKVDNCFSINGTGNMSEENVQGTLNPAYLSDSDKHSDAGHGGKSVGDFKNDDLVSHEIVLDIDTEPNTNSTYLITSGSKGTPAAEVAPLQDVKISVTDTTEDKKKVNNTPVVKVESSPTNAQLSLVQSAKKRSKMSDSLKIQENPPPGDANTRSSRPRSWIDSSFRLRNWTDEDTKWLEWIEVKFKEIAGDDGQIDLDEFKKALGVKKSFFAERFFMLFDQDDSGTIELGELMDGLRMLTKGSAAQKLQFLFDVYDEDASGSIERDELQNVLKACMEESSLSLTNDNLEDLTSVLFDAADEDDSGEITFDELKSELEKHPGVVENLTISAAQWLKPPEKSSGGKSRFRYFTADYIRNNCRKVIFFFVYWLINIALFIVAVWQYRESNRWIQVARGCGLCLNFNCMWVLVLMLRKCITFVRMTKLCHVLPLDQNILFHKMTGIAIAGFSLVHSLAHIGNAATVSDTSILEMWEVLFTTKAGVGFVGSSAFITGWLLDIILVIIVICSLPFVRRGGHFQVFYWSHMLYVPFWILVILHGPQFWKWFVVPGVMFILEKVSRSKLIKMARYGDTYIEEVNLLPSKVTHLVISKSVNFKYQPGDYIFIQIPEIAAHEWHPFTISSAPEMEGHIWLHVRSAGHWTNKLYEFFDELNVEETSNSKRRASRFSKFAGSRRRTAMSRKSTKSKIRQTNKIVKIKCFVDGPYGTGTREVFDTDHAILVGAGIGVTPMASILQSVWYKFAATRQTCPSCEHVWYPEEESETMNLKKVDFIWINRDQRSFEWFLTILNQLELEQSSHHGALENCIQMHMYMTAAQKKTDMKGIGLQIALDLMYDKSHRDLITGLRTKTEPGRPDWNKIFKGIKDENKGKVKVFFCGAPALGKTIKEAAEKFNFSFSKENF